MIEKEKCSLLFDITLIVIIKITFLILYQLHFMSFLSKKRRKVIGYFYFAVFESSHNLDIKY